MPTPDQRADELTVDAAAETGHLAGGDDTSSAQTRNTAIEPLPDAPAELRENTRTYLRIQPADTPLTPSVVESHIPRLYDLCLDGQRNSVLDRLRGRHSVRTLEWVLTSEGGPESPLRYYVGIDDEDALANLEQILRGLFPETYRITQTEWHPAHVFSSASEGGHERTEQHPAVDGTRTNAQETQDDVDAAMVTGVEFRGRATRQRDWQTHLTPFRAFLEDDPDRGHQIPLAAVAAAMTTASTPSLYQVLLQPKADWTAAAEDRRLNLELGSDTFGQSLRNAFLGPPDEDHTLSEVDRDRLDSIRARDTQRSFAVNARCLAVTDTATDSHPLQALETAFSHVGRQFYGITSRVWSDRECGTRETNPSGSQLRTAICDRTFHPPTYERLATRLPWVANESRGIVADVSEVPSFFLLDGTAVTTAGTRALATTPDERASLPLPPETLLETYRTPGLTLGTPLTGDDTPASQSIALPSSLQPLHVAWFGKTGSGKSTALTNAILDNHAATPGADILIDPKGDGLPIEYLRAHYAREESLEDIYYFDCAETLPALSFFDIREELKADIDRSTAVTDRIDHYLEILTTIMGRDRFERAVRSPDIIRYLLKALFDPAYGDDAFTHRELRAAVRQMHESRDAPPVMDPDLEMMLTGVTANSKRSFNELMQGVANRIEKISLDDRLAHLFNHVPLPGTDDPQFDFRDVLDEDVVIIFDTGRLRDESQRALTLVLLSNLWTALRRRARDAPATDDPPLVNLYLEEAATVATSGLMTNLLAQSRSFGLSITLAMQFPAQLRTADQEAYDELLNNVSTVVTGNVSVDHNLCERLATADVGTREVGNRLRALRRGQWLVRLPNHFADPEPRPFTLASAPLPPGHPDGDEPLSEAMEAAFQARLALRREQTRETAGLDTTSLERMRTASSTRSNRRLHRERRSAADGREQSSEQRVDEADRDDEYSRVDTALPYSKRMPSCAGYDEETHATLCRECLTRYDPTIEGMKRAISCCRSLDDVDRGNVPICEVNLKLTLEERLDSPYSDRQLSFLQAVYSAHQLRYDPLAYDPVQDSMVLLQEYVGISAEAVQELVHDELLSHDGDFPHRLFTVTPAGRDEIKVRHREGIAHGPGKGDVNESTLHVVMVELGRRYIEQAFVDDPHSRVVEAVSYLETDEIRLDAAGLDKDGTILVTTEAERINNNPRTAVQRDFDKMAAFDPEAAIWVVEGREEAHDILEALNDPADGEVRVEKSYSRNSPPQRFMIDTPGLTDVYTLSYLRDTVLE